MLQLLQEPTVNLCKFMNLLYAIANLQCFGKYEDTHVGRFVQWFGDIGNLNLMVLYKTMHALSNHSQTFLKCLLKSASNSHHFADALHGRAEFALNTVELGEVPTWNLDYDIVKSGLEECRGCLSYRVLQVEETITQSELGCNKCQRITGGLRCQCWWTAETGVDFDNAIILRVRVKGILYVTLTNDADMADNLNGKCAQLVILCIAERLWWSYYNWFTRMDAEWVKVLHVTYGDTVIETVAYYFILYLFPTLQTLLYQYLWWEGEGFLCLCQQLFFIVAETRTQTSQCIGGTENDRESECLGSLLYFFNGAASLALDGLDANLIEAFNKEIAVFSVNDGLYWGA